MKRRFLALVLAGCLAAVLSTAAWAMCLNVELPSGETIALDVESGDSIDNVKQKVQNAAGVSVTEQYLYYGGKFLYNGRTLADYNIQKESTLLVASEAKGTPSGTPLTAAEPSKEWVDITEEKVLTEGTYFLCNNVNLTHPLVIQGDVTLDLNGFVLQYENSGANDSVIQVDSGTLTLVDSHPTAIHKFVKNTDDLWMLDESQGAGIVRGGIITGGNAGYNDGGGVYVCPGAELVMRGGSIVGCKAKQGGGVYVADKNEAKTLGRFTMKGGSIVGCVATDESYSGGGVANHGDFTMTGGTIHRCSTTEGSGGGICSVRQLHISGSAIVTDCKAGGSYASSGAMLISPGSTYTAVIAGGTFDGNVENSKGTITGGTFNGQVRNSGVIENGQFNGAVNNYEGTIKGGTFNGTVTNEGAGRISGGTYNGSVYGTFYTVAFVSNGGTAVPNQKYANTPVTAPTVSRAGYTLVGWYTDEACTAAYDFTQPVTDNITLYAKWEAAPRYYYNSGTTETGKTDENKKGSPKTFDPGAGIYAVSVALSLTGTAWIGRKRH
ncbi:MAG: InlB B-repeat-containing protein [Firmicutes bacterium]|nr:InlB B-repeat-containing protein [Bacillota bacterium]